MKTQQTVDMDTARQMAREIAPKVFVVDGPIGGYGFRSGRWTVKIDGQKYEFFASVSHAADLETQYEHIRNRAAMAFVMNRLTKCKN